MNRPDIAIGMAQKCPLYRKLSQRSSYGYVAEKNGIRRERSQKTGIPV